jgi:hypothetical protein
MTQNLLTILSVETTTKYLDLTKKRPCQKSILILIHQECLMKFDNVRTHNDTDILLNLECKFGEYDALYQEWIWDGIKANSLIFNNRDITDLELLIEEVRNSALVNDFREKITSSINKKYTYINFNFLVF